jgi:hypothetical protein
MSIYVPPRLKVICDENIGDDRPKINLINASNSSVGIYFIFADYAYLYEYIEDDIDEDDILKSVRLKDIRMIEGGDGLFLDIHRNEFKLVKIIEFEDKCIISQVLQMDTVDVEYWVIKGLGKVFSELYTYYRQHKVIIEEADHFLE